MVRRYKSSQRQRKTLKKGRKERAVPGTLDAFNPIARRNAGWFGESQRHSQAAKEGHRAAGRSGGGGTPGHQGRPGAAEYRAAERSSDPMADLLKANRLGDDDIMAARVAQEKTKPKTQAKLVTFTDEDGDKHQVDTSKAKPVNAPLGIDKGQEVENPHGDGGRFHSHDDPSDPHDKEDWHYDDRDPYPSDKPTNPADMAQHIVQDVVINQAQKSLQREGLVV